MHILYFFVAVFRKSLKKETVAESVERQNGVKLLAFSDIREHTGPKLLLSVAKIATKVSVEEFP